MNLIKITNMLEMIFVIELFQLLMKIINLKVSHLLKLKQWHDEQYDILQYSAKQFIQEFVKFDEQSKYLEVSRQSFNDLPNSLKMVVLDCLLSKYYELFNISAKTYEEWFKQFSSKKAQFSINLTDKWIIQIAYGKLIIMAKIMAIHILEFKLLKSQVIIFLTNID